MSQQPVSSSSDEHRPNQSGTAFDATVSAPSLGTKVRNLLVVMVAVILSVAIVLGLRNEATTASLDHLAQRSMPLEIALGNGKPTMMEFYADWCTTCQAMAGDIESLEDKYAGQVNFVMLNVDNAKWLPELVSYRVDGIPHFVFLTPQGEAIGAVIGEQPRAIMAANLEALMAGDSLPHAQSSGQVSAFQSPIVPKGQTDPRSHGSQVVSP